MDNSLEELRKKAVIEITNKIVNDMTMSEAMQVIIDYSEQTAQTVVRELDRESLERVTNGEVIVEKKVKRTVNQNIANTASTKINSESLWENIFKSNKKKHTGWNKKKEKEETFFSRIKKFLNLDE